MCIRDRIKKLDGDIDEGVVVTSPKYFDVLLDMEDLDMEENDDFTN